MTIFQTSHHWHTFSGAPLTELSITPSGNNYRNLACLMVISRRELISSGSIRHILLVFDLPTWRWCFWKRCPYNLDPVHARNMISISGTVKLPIPLFCVTRWPSVDSTYTVAMFKWRISEMIKKQAQAVSQSKWVVKTESLESHLTSLASPSIHLHAWWYSGDLPDLVWFAALSCYPSGLFLVHFSCPVNDPMAYSSASVVITRVWSLDSLSTHIVVLQHNLHLDVVKKSEREESERIT